MARIRNSALLSTLGVLAAGGVFAFALYSFYPSGDDQEANVPVIKADAEPIRIEPVDVGGMDIPFRDSTVYDSMRRADAGQGRNVENLLAPSSQDGLEEPMSQEEVVAAVEKQVSELEQAEEKVTEVQEDVNQSATETKQEIAEAKTEMEEVKEQVASADVTGVEKTQIKNILENDVEAETETKAEADVTTSTDTNAGEEEASPETLAFVRSVLDKKDANKLLSAPSTSSATTQAAAKTESSTPDAIEPAAGVEGDVVTSGSSFVQLASITDRARADAEWSKLKEQFAAIPGASKYRVQEANLEKGTFYRIQAGPYSEAQAKSICESIKAQKSGGCFVTK